MPRTSMSTPQPRSFPLVTAHHDGSRRYVSDPYPRVGDAITLRVHVAAELGATRVALRSTPDGDQHFEACAQEPGSHWWSVAVPMVNTQLGYRFLIDTSTGALTLNATGLHAREVTDAHDFRVSTDPAPPEWTRRAVFYEIFLDRFAKGEAATPAGEPLPGWAILTEWDEPVAHGTPNGVRQLYGGDLPGVEQHLGYLHDLGVTTIYLTPFFPAGSNHRYDASSFDVVDPLLGGDEALKRLTNAAHAKHMMVIGDLTLNHTGENHAWFRNATADATSPEAGFYLFSHHPVRYECFGGVRSMPKLDHRSDILRRRLFEGAGSVVDRYLTSFGLDGWRIDVAQSAGYSGPSNRTLTTAAQTVATAQAARPEAYVVAEHQFDASSALAGNAWHGTMAYAAFTRPLWSWLAETDIDRHWGAPGGHRPYTGSEMAHVIDDFNGLIPWRSRIHSLLLLDSHDTPRLLSIIGRDRYLVALGLLMTMPGIPMIFAGDEIGTTGANLEEGRQPFRWDPVTWDHDLRRRHQELIHLRRTLPALYEGGFRWLHTSDDVVIFERATAEQVVIVQAARRSHAPIPCPIAAIGLLGSDDLTAGANFPATGPALQLWSTTRAISGQD
ncbi:glycoside hydrolase family 13 protein [Humibacillus sp. DSM 29435]|uniref:glycoside hydrolase family 13 protein n=1 Tax=Humibacillus sp. DSM 29435 TaxID=1869167 RepID=UPI000B00AD84|nr:glycoside hydrolase family 13 protein [Humibacillus sp. DSM 29435]